MPSDSNLPPKEPATMSDQTDDMGFAPTELDDQDTTALKLETAKRRLDRALNALEQRVALTSERLRQTDASDVAQLRDHARQVEREKQHLVHQLRRLDDYLGAVEGALSNPPALPSQTQPSQTQPGKNPATADEEEA